MSTSEADPAVLIIGYGNPLRGDDGVGWRVAEKLEESLRRPDVRVMACHQLLPEMAEPISRAKLVIFIDASVADAPGEIACREIHPAAGADSAAELASHDLGPPVLLATARQLFGQSADGVIFSVGGEDFGMGEQLSPKVLQAADELVKRVEDYVARGAWSVERGA